MLSYFQVKTLTIFILQLNYLHSHFIPKQNQQENSPLWQTPAEF